MSDHRELDQFLRSVERRGFQRAVYAVRDADAALDIVQEAMISLARHYADRPAAEWPLLFNRILSNAILDAFRRQRTRDALFTSASALGNEEDDGLDLLAVLADAQGLSDEGPETLAVRQQWLRVIEQELEQLPARQREAFLMRYWEELDVAQTAAAMGCSEGSVKTHCSRAIQSLARALKARGLMP